MRFLTLVKVEWIKTMRMRSTYIAFAAIGLLVMLVQFGLYFGADESDYYQFLKQNGFNTSLLVNGYVGTRFAMEVGFGLLAAPMIILTFARQVAGEDLRGTLRLILSRPISRVALMNAKFVVCATYCLMLMAFFIALSYGVGIALYGPQRSLTIGRFSEMNSGQYAERGESTPNVGRREWDRMSEQERAAIRDRRRKENQNRNFKIAELIISPSDCAKRLAIAAVLSSWALLTVGSIAFFFSVINKHPIAAMALTIGTYFMVLIVQGLASNQNIIPLFKRIEPYLFTTAMDFWRGCLSFEIDWERVRREGTLLGSYSAGFYALATFIFWRKDITS